MVSNFSSFFLLSYSIFFTCQMQCWNLSKRKSHLAESMYFAKENTRESHWFTPRQTVIFHKLPQHSLLTEYLFNVFLRDKMLPQAINHSTSLPFISLHQITWLLAKWTASPPREIYCMYFLCTKWDVVDLFFLAHCVFRHSISLSPVQSSVPQVLRCY